MYYYKIIYDGQVIGIHSGPDAILDDNYLEINFEEYCLICDSLGIEHQEEEVNSIDEKDAQIAALEEENAALLYKLLTGEEFE